MMRRSIALLAISIFLTGPAVADSKFYFGASYGEGDLEAFSAEPTALGFKFGREFGNWLGIELHASFAADEAEDAITDPEIKVGAAFIRLNLPLDKVNIYVLGGQSVVYYDRGTIKTDDSEAAGGFGFDLIASENNMLTIESMVYNYDSPLEYKVVSIGFTHRFELPGIR